MPRPRTRIETASHANDPEITMIRYRRGPDNPVWEAQIALPDRTKKIVSTRETDVMKAQFAAVWLKQQITGQLMATGTAELRKPRIAKPSGPTFEAAARQVITDIELQRQTTAHALRAAPPEIVAKKLAKYRNHTGRIERVLLPALGNLTYAEITTERLDQFVRAIRVRSDADGERVEVSPRQSTVGNIAHTYGKVMDVLRRLSGATTEYPKISKRGLPRAEPKASFSADDVGTLVRAMSDEWVASPKRETDRAIRRLLRAYVHICAATGIRPGLEMEHLTFGSFSTMRDAGTGRRVTVVSIARNAGKYTADRTAVVYDNDPHADFNYALRELRDMHGDAPSTQLIFALPAPDRQTRRNHRTGKITCRAIPDLNSTFRGLLESLGLRRVPGSPEPRSLYSLRHYYANAQILAGRDIYALAKIMGTSVGMIETYYARSLGIRHAPKFAGLHDAPVDRALARLSRGAKNGARTEADDDPDDHLRGIEIPD